MNKQGLILKYEGLAVQNHSMDSFKTANRIIAFAEFIQRIGYLLTNKKINIDVKAIAPGSFEIQFCLNFIGMMASIFATDVPFTLSTLIEILKCYFSCLDFLQGQEPREIKRLKNNKIQVQNCQGNINIFQDCTFNFYRDELLSKRRNEAMVNPIKEDDLDSSKIINTIPKNHEVIADINHKNINNYKLHESKEQIITNPAVQMVLYVISPNFEKNRKWELSDGKDILKYEMLDSDFINKIDQGETFSKGDELLVDLEISQFKTGFKTTTERKIIKVKQHSNPTNSNNKQLGLFDK